MSYPGFKPDIKFAEALKICPEIKDKLNENKSAIIDTYVRSVMKKLQSQFPKMTFLRHHQSKSVIECRHLGATCGPFADINCMLSESYAPFVLFWENRKSSIDCTYDDLAKELTPVHGYYP